MHPLVEEALRIRKMTGEAGYNRWYMSLSPEERSTFQGELDKTAAEISAIVAAFTDALDRAAEAMAKWNDSIGARG